MASSSMVLLTFLFVTSCLTSNVFSNEVDENVSWTQSPHHAPSYQPAAAPSPHHHRNNTHHHHHHNRTKLATPPTAHSPTKAPVHAPVHAPAQPPSSSPAPVAAPMPARKFVAVQGVVYCKSCKYTGVDTLLGATPLMGAEVLLTCNNTKYPLRVKGTTDKNGYFFIKPPKTLTTYGSHTCRVTLLTSPMATCNAPTNLHAGLKGSLLVPSKKPPLSSPNAGPLPYDVFSVGPFAFESKTPCNH
ncbi:hypothetical protein Tco_0535980 [Tanacetum coccineum]